MGNSPLGRLHLVNGRGRAIVPPLVAASERLAGAPNGTRDNLRLALHRAIRLL